MTREGLRKAAKTLLPIAAMCVCLACGVRADTVDDLQASLEAVFSGDTDSALAAAGTLSSLFSAKNVFDYLIKLFVSCFSDNAAPVSVMTATVLLSALIGIFDESGGAKPATVCCLCGQTAAVFSLVTPLLAVVEGALQHGCAFITGMAGSLSVLSAASGMESTAAVTVSSGAAIAAIGEMASVRVILPCIRVILALSALGILSDTVNVSGITSFLRSFCIWGLGVVFALFGCVHTVLVKVTSGADELLLRGVRTSAARLIPVAGSMVADCLESVLGALKQIRAGAGGLGIAYLVFLFLPPLVSVLCVKAILLFVGFAAKTLGQHRHAALLDSTGSALNLLFAVTLFCFACGAVIFAAMLG